MIYETIVTTMNESGDVHTTPFGICKQDGLVIIAPFKPSTTLANILTTGYAVVNMTDDVRVFAGTLTGRTAWSLEMADKIPGFRLADTLVHQELKLVRVEDDALRPQLFLEVIHQAQHAAFQGFNRAQAAVIELAVLVSRLKRLPMEKIQQEMEYLRIAIEKTAGEREMQAWSWLSEAVMNHQAALDSENLA